MIKRKLAIFVGVLLLNFTTFSQVPQIINYQAVMRDATGAIMNNAPIAIRFTITDGAVDLYSEEKIVTTTDHGLINTVVGSTLNPLDGVDWGIEGLMLQVEIDTGAGFVDLGANELASVPYALQADRAGLANEAVHAFDADYATVSGHAQTADNATNSDYSDTANVAHTSLDQLWTAQTGGAIAYADTDPTANGYVARISTTTNLTSGQDVLHLYNPPGGATDFNFLTLKHGLLSSPVKFQVKGDGTTYLGHTVARDQLGETGVNTSGALYEDNTPIAWAYIGSTGQVIDSYGIATVTNTGTGEYEIVMDVTVNGYPCVMVQGVGSTASNNYYANVDFPFANSSLFKVHTGAMSSSTATPTNRPFCVVVFGRPQ